MANWLRELDDLLRGRKADPRQLAEGTEHLRLGPHASMAVVLGAVYGLSMGLYAVVSRTPPVPAQLAASAVKVPALFLLTLAVTFPSLYVFSALVGSRLGPAAVLRVVVSAITVNLAVLASFAPITAFFTLTTTSYPFMKLLSVFFLAASGVVGLAFLLNLLRRIEGAAPAEAAQPNGDTAAAEPGDGGPVARNLFKVWLVVYALVGVQMAWLLRPFIGSPDLPFAWFRQRGGNVFLDLMGTIGEFLGT